MKVTKNTTTTAVALILMLTMAILIIALPAVQAQRVYPTVLLISAAPNPVGVGQIVYVNAFMSTPTPTASGALGDRFENITVQIVRPDGTKETFGPYVADPTGGIWFTYVPAKTGNYTLQAFYPGQTLRGWNPYYPTPAGLVSERGNIMKPSESVKLTLVVQEDPIKPIYVSPPLPTEYWSRPIYATNYAWAALGGSWLGLAPSGFAVSGYYDAVGCFMPYTTAPNTGHILWTKPTAFGGQVGAPTKADQESQYMSTSIVTRSFEPIILYGILYYVHYPEHSGHPASWIAVDLRTGEEVWNKPCGTTGDEILRYGQIVQFHTRQEYGCTAYLWSVPRTGTTVLRLYDPMTCRYICEIVNDTQNLSMIADYDCNEQGTLLGWYVTTNATGRYLNMWNSTQALAYPAGFPATGVHAATYRPDGSINWSKGMEKPGGWTVPIPTTLAGNPISLSIGATTPEVTLLREAPVPTGFVYYSLGYQITAGIDAKTGQLLWGPINQTLPLYHVMSLVAARDGVYVLHDKDTNEAYGYSLTNGKLLWGPVKLPGNAWSHISRTGEIAYGNVYIWDFGGMVYCLDKDTGKIKWTFTRGSSGYDTGHGVYPLWTYKRSIVDGKLFLAEGSLYNPPLHPAKLLAINATTGELVWSIFAYSSRITAAHADGMMVQWNSFDKQIYCHGKGQTATTIAASPEVSVHGSSVLVKGMVTDESPGTKNPDRVARFPHGVPAVADECMSAWMEYVYMQQPRPTNATGVEVTLDTIDPNGNFVHIGTVTTDTSGMYKKMFVPEVPGEYTIIATFAGSESYWPSYAETAIGVGEAPPATPPPEYPVPADYTLTIIAAAIAIIIAVAIVGLILFRKKP